jgi:hypothetical protein
MKFKTMLGAWAISSLLAARAAAQVTVVTVCTNGLNEPYNIAQDTGFNL